MNSLIVQIQHLIDFRKEIGQPIEQYFLPGLSPDIIREKIAQYPFYFPEEFIELYSWHNGTVDEDFLMFRDMAWSSLEDAINEYTLMLDNFWSNCDNEEIGLEPEKMFPFAGFTGFNLYLSYPGQKMCPALELPVICTGKGVLEPYYESFPAMLSTVAEWFQVGEHVEYGYEAEPSIEEEIWRKYNPELFRIRGSFRC
jgi:hypothetical protein